MKIGQQQPAFVVLLSAALFGATIPSTSNAQTTTEGPATAGGTLALTPELLRLAELAVILSHYTFTNASVLLPILSDDDGDSAASQSNMTMFFREEPDAALVSKKGGHCFGAFRGTNGGWEDWQQNLRKGSSAACGPSGCCDVQRGFHQVYFDPSYRQDFENALRECVATCAAEQPCPVVLTGNSQGGAAAVVAAIALADLVPIVITFGQPAVVMDLPCDAIDHGKLYRFQNSRTGIFGPTYDPVPSLDNSARHIGHQIMLSDDDTGVAYIGLDTETTFSPWDLADRFATHRLDPENVGYIARIQSLVRVHGANNPDNVRSNGFTDGTRCSEDVECAAGSCRRKRCQEA